MQPEVAGSAIETRGAAVPLNKLRLSGVAYLNARPVLHGLIWRSAPPCVAMDVPSALAEQLVAGRRDAALAPVATLALRPDLELVPGICIGADGPVASVFIVSERPLQELDTLLLDTHSRTSVVLTGLLVKHLRRGQSIEYQQADHARMAREVRGRTGALVIGDAAVAMRDSYNHVLDLGEQWKLWTGLPFVFAGWVAQRGVLGFAARQLLERSLQAGLEARPGIAHEWARQHGGEAEWHLRYLTEHIRYRLDERFEAGLREFLDRAAAEKLLDPVTVRFAGAS